MASTYSEPKPDTSSIEGNTLPNSNSSKRLTFFAAYLATQQAFLFPDTTALSSYELVHMALNALLRGEQRNTDAAACHLKH